MNSFVLHQELYVLKRDFTLLSDDIEAKEEEEEVLFSVLMIAVQ